MKSWLKFLWIFILFAGRAFALEHTPTGFYYPLEDIGFSECGEWLERPDGGGCYGTSGVYHIGTDMTSGSSSLDKEVYAVADGTVVQYLSAPGDNDSWGVGNTALLVEHRSYNRGMFRAVYGHVRWSSVPAIGDPVRAGAAIAKIGPWSSGSHLHFGMLSPGRTGAIDPGRNGRWPLERYGLVYPNTNYFDNGFIDPIWFITHNAPDNWRQLADYTYCPAVIPEVTNPWFPQVCGEGSSSNPPSPCIGLDISLYQQCLAGQDVCDPNFGSYGGSPSGGQGSGSSLLNLTGEFRLKIDGRIINHFTEAAIVGQTYETEADLTAHGDDTVNWMEPGKETVEAEIQYKIGSGPWTHNKTVSILATALDRGQTVGDKGSITIPNTNGEPISFRVKVNTTNEAYENDYSDNTSEVKAYQVQLSGVDLTIPYASLTGGRTFLKTGDNIGLQTAVRNIGTQTPVGGSRLSYNIYGPSTNNVWTRIADDGSDAGELIPWRDQPEQMLTELSGYTNAAGWHTAMVCADYQNSTPETDENNNCYSFSYEVKLVLPDFIVADMYLKVGSTVIREGGTVKKDSYVHPYCVVQNIGTTGIHAGFRMAYYIDATNFRDSDGLDPNELCIGCMKTEYVSTDSIRLGTTGARTYQCCADYQGAVPELVEWNNCAIMNFSVVR